MLKLCYSLGISPKQLYTHEIQVADFSPRSLPESLSIISHRIKCRHYINYNHIQEKFTAIVNDVNNSSSMSEVGKTLGIHVQTLHRHFPDLCQQIIKKYQQSRQINKIKRIEQDREMVRSITYMLHTRGEYPSAVRVAQYLPTAARMQRPEYINSWRQAMQELGYPVNQKHLK